MDGEISYASNVRLPSLNKTFHYSYQYSRNWIGIRGRHSGQADEIGIGLKISGSVSDEKAGPEIRARIPTPVWNTVQRNFSCELGRNKDIFCLNGENQLVCRQIN